VSPFCIGIVADAHVIPAAFEAGINFFFVSADMHWPLYEATRRGLRDLLASKPNAREEIVVGVVSYVTQLEFCYAPFNEVVDELGENQRIEVAIIGGSYGHEVGHRLAVYQQHRANNFLGTRAIGASFHDRAAALELVNRNAVDIAYVRSNVVHPGAHEDLFPHVKPRGEGRTTLIYNFKSTEGFLLDDEYAQLGLDDDYWRPHVTDYYRFAFGAAALDGLLIALPYPRAVQDLADAMAKGPLDDEDRKYLLDLADLSEGRAKLAAP
jgi:hypothetical protein